MQEVIFISEVVGPLEREQSVYSDCGPLLNPCYVVWAYGPLLVFLALWSAKCPIQIIIMLQWVDIIRVVFACLY